MNAHAYPDVTRGSEILRGMRAGVPVVIASAPFGLLFGALAIENGLTVFEATLMSATIFAGASQLVGLNLFRDNVAPWLIVFSIFAVNFRHILYSAAVGRRIRHWPIARQAVAFFFLVDPQYAETERQIANGRTIGFGWYMGMGIVIYCFWVLNSLLGAVFGRMLPDTHMLGFDFLLPIYFFGLVLEFRTRPLFLPVVAASALGSIIAYETVGSPWHVSIGALAGIAVALLAPVKRQKGDAA